MLRIAAAVVLVLAAFAVPVPFLDRAGVALCGAAIAALGVGRAPRPSRVADAFLPPSPHTDGGDELDVLELRERLRAYAEAGSEPARD